MSLPMSAPPVAGDYVSDFVLPDSTGAMRRLHELVAQRTQALIFFRGAW